MVFEHTCSVNSRKETHFHSQRCDVHCWVQPAQRRCRLLISQAACYLPGDHFLIVFSSAFKQAACWGGSADGGMLNRQWVELWCKELCWLRWVTTVSVKTQVGYLHISVLLYLVYLICSKATVVWSRQAYCFPTDSLRQTTLTGCCYKLHIYHTDVGVSFKATFLQRGCNCVEKEVGMCHAGRSPTQRKVEFLSTCVDVRILGDCVRVCAGLDPVAGHWLWYHSLRGYPHHRDLNPTPASPSKPRGSKKSAPPLQFPRPKWRASLLPSTSTFSTNTQSWEVSGCVT